MPERILIIRFSALGIDCPLDDSPILVAMCKNDAAPWLIFRPTFYFS